MSRMTVWGEQILAGGGTLTPLSEYPRPQLVRDSYLNFNGTWEYAITQSPRQPREWDGEILVPFAPESALSGVNRRVLPTDHLWYRRTVRIPEGFNRGRVWLTFGAVDQLAEILLDGVVIARHQGGYLPFRVDITAAADGAVHELALHVRDLTDTSFLARGKQALKPGGIWYTPHSGIWQTVWMESTPDVAVEGLYITPGESPSSVTITVTTTQPTEITIEAFSPIIADGDPAPDVIPVEGEVAAVVSTDTTPAQRVASTSRPPGMIAQHAGLDPQRPADNTWTSVSFELELDSDHLWTPDTPWLYPLRITAGQDTVTSYTAVRTVTKVGDRGSMRLRLNDVPTLHAGVLDQGYWPDGLVTAPSDAALVWDIQTMKSLGFTMLRKHIKIEPMRWYFHADRLGMMVWQDAVNGGRPYSRSVVQVPAVASSMSLDDSLYPIFGRQDADGRMDFWRELAEMIGVLGSSPSIVAWVPFNEGWGQFDATSVASAVAAWDPSRVVDHASGWHDQGAGDITSPHIYFRKVSWKKQWEAFDRAVVVSEYGGYSLRLEGHEFSSREFGYRRFTTSEDLTEAWVRLHERQILPTVKAGLAGFVYTQLSDVEDELNGIVTADRTVIKIDADQVRRVNASLRQAFREATR